MFLLALIACSQPAPAPVLVTPVPTPEPAKVSPTLSPIEVLPLGIQWNGDSQTLQVETRLHGAALEARKDVVYVGVTVVTDDDQVFDLLVHSVFPAAFEESLLFSTHLPATPKHVLIGAWNKKISPCTVARPGCKEFGFVLDGSLGSFPAGLYDAGRRQRMLPKKVQIAVMGQAPEAIRKAADFAAVFGSTIDVLPGKARAVASGIFVRHQDDLPLATAMAAGSTLKVSVDPRITTDVLLLSDH